MKRSGIIVLIVAICLSFIVPAELWSADKFPVKPIEFIFGNAAGADGEVLTRPAMDTMSKILGQPIMYVYKPGAGNSIGYRALMQAKPDGYSVGWASAGIITNKLMGILDFDYHDFIMLGHFAAQSPVVVASTATNRPFKTIQEVVDFGKAHPNEVKIASSSTGTIWWIAALDFARAAGIEANVIPQAGGGALQMAQVAGGHVDLAVVGIASAKSMVDSGKVRLLAGMGPQRPVGIYSKTPTMKELGYNTVIESLNIMMAPPKTTKLITDIWVNAMKTAVTDPAYIKFCEEKNVRPEYMTPEQIISNLDRDRQTIRDIMAKVGVLKEGK